MDPGFAQNAWFENRLQWCPSVSVVKIQADGKILVAGNFTHAAGIARAGLARFDSDGKLDGEFNADLGTWAAVGSADLMPDGRILIGGNFTSVNDVARTNVARLNAD